MKILALDTSSDACSAAISLKGQVYRRFEVEPRAHTRLILPMIDAVLAEAGLALTEVDAIAFGCGPGAFTGVRIGAGVTQGLALAADKPVIAVSTLAALAQQMWVQHQAEQVLVAVDARMNEVYWGAYQLQGQVMCLQGAEQVVNPGQLAPPAWRDCWAVGTGWQMYADALQSIQHACVQQVQASIYPAAEYLLPLALRAAEQDQLMTPDEIEPTYLRNRVALTLAERKLQ